MPIRSPHHQPGWTWRPIENELGTFYEIVNPLGQSRLYCYDRAMAQRATLALNVLALIGADLLIVPTPSRHPN